MVTQRGDEPLPGGNLDARHYRAVHRHLFQDVYEWAGQFRTIRISKDESMFCYPENIPLQLDALFAQLAADDYLSDLGREGFSARGAHFLSELNAIHAFREGNGRTQMTFFAMLADMARHPLDLSRLRPEGFLNAMVAAFNGSERSLADQIRGLL